MQIDLEIKMTRKLLMTLTVAVSSLTLSAVALAEDCQQLIKNEATDFHTKSRTQDKYRWKASTDFSMNFRGGCDSSDYHINHSAFGRSAQVSSSIMDLDSKGGMMKGGDPWNRKDAMFFGYKIHGFNKSGTSVKTEENFKEWQFFDISYTYGVDLGPFEFGAQVGIAGDAYITGERSFAFEDNSQALAFYPGLDIYGYARAGADIVVAEVWIGGQLSFVKEELTAELAIAYVVDEDTGALALETEMSVFNQLEILSGKLFAEAELLGSVWEHNFIEWWGFQYNQEIWNSSEGFVIRDAFTRQSLPDVLMPGMPAPPPAS